MSLVLDASVALAWLLGEAPTSLSIHARQALIDGVLHAPAIWPLEVANGLLIQARRQRIGWEDCAAGLQQATALPVQVDGGDAVIACGPVAALARERELTIYDASYVELALRLDLPLATLDGRLRRAAAAAGARILDPEPGAPAPD